MTGSDNATKEAVPFTASAAFGGFDVPCETAPGTELGTGERFNMPRPESNSVVIYPTNVTAGDVIEISEVRRVASTTSECPAP